MTLTSYTLNSVKLNVTGYNSIKNASPAAVSVSAALHNASEASNKTAYNITVNDVYMVSNPLITDVSLVGGYQELPLNSSIFNDAWTQVLKTYQNLQNYTLLEVRSQVVAGIKFIFAA